MPSGTLRDTYVAALQHDLVDVSDADLLLGVVRRPAGWFTAAVDENDPALAPPESLLDAVQERKTDLKMAGLCDEGAHNAAWDEVDFAARYERHLDEDTDVRRALERLRDRLADGDDVVLVCYENTAKKRCHRTILLDRLESEGVPAAEGGGSPESAQSSDGSATLDEFAGGGRSNSSD